MLSEHLAMQQMPFNDDMELQLIRKFSHNIWLCDKCLLSIVDNIVAFISKFENWLPPFDHCAFKWEGIYFRNLAKKEWYPTLLQPFTPLSFVAIATTITLYCVN